MSSSDPAPDGSMTASAILLEWVPPHEEQKAWAAQSPTTARRPTRLVSVSSRQDMAVGLARPAAVDEGGARTEGGMGPEAPSL